MLYYIKMRKIPTMKTRYASLNFPVSHIVILYPLYERDNTNTIANIHIFRKSVKKNNDFFRPKIPPLAQSAFYQHIIYSVIYT